MLGSQCCLTLTQFELYLQTSPQICSEVTCFLLVRKLISEQGFELGFPVSLYEFLNNQITSLFYSVEGMQ